MKKTVSVVLALVLAMSFVLCFADEKAYKEIECEELKIATRVPADAAAGYEKDVGLVVYTKYDGYIPYITVMRRPEDKKFSNPVNYLNNVYREYMEDSYGSKSRGMNPAKTWEVGGKELPGALYMYEVDGHLICLLKLIEVRDGGDVEYTAKYEKDVDEDVMTALDEIVRNYMETDIGSQPEADPPEDADVPFFMTPDTFVAEFNNAMCSMADVYADMLGEDGVKILKENYTLTQADPQGQLRYFGNADWSVEAGFFYADAGASDDTPAQAVSLTVKNGTPEIPAYFARFILQIMIGYEYQDEVEYDVLRTWFEQAEGPDNVFTLPGYTVTILKTDEYVQYSVSPVSPEVPLAE